MFKFNLTYVALAAALSSSFVYADPTTYTHLSGAKVIDIEKPNAAGVSHNMYREFNVDSKGVVLNNSPSDLSHATLGNIAKNNNLTNGSASVILNEVTSNRASSLNGFIEVAGQRADVVIANPNGISCSGCSFINTNKAILTTGKVTFSDTGAIASYDVTGGKLSIDKNGMDASNSYAVLLADAIAINGTVNATNAIVAAGNFTFDNGSGAITSAGKAATARQYVYPEYSIDISNLGGIKANSITMVGNNLGFGVRNKGAIVANTSLSLTSFGSLTNEGSIASNGMMTQVVSAGNFKNTGNISSNNIALLNSLSSISNSGTISSTGNLLVNASGNIENTGKFKAASTLSVMTNGNLKTTYGSNLLSDNQLTVTAAGNIENGGSTRGKNTTVTFGGDTLKVTGNIFGYDTLLVQAKINDQITSGEITNSGTTSGGNVTVKTDGTLALTKGSFMEATDTLTTKSYWLKNEGYMGADTIAIDNYVIHNYGAIVGQDNVGVKTYHELYNEGEILSSSNMTLDTRNHGNITNRSHIGAGGTLTMSVNKVVNGGYRCGFLGWATCGKGTITTTNLVLNSSHKYASEMGGTQQFKSATINTIN